MNLLREPWIPVSDATGFRRLTLRQVLCEEGEWTICLPRDDMELAALQLAVCLTQTVLTPASHRELVAREATPLCAGDYEHAIDAWTDLFDLRDPRHPFMQNAATCAGKQTPVQRLFPGLPDQSAVSDNAQAFFHATDEIPMVCLPCAAIALFQHSTNGVNFGGKFMSGLKDMVPVTTLVRGSSLRRTLWRNVLSTEFMRQTWPELSTNAADTMPTWHTPIRRRAADRKPVIEAAGEIGLVRGLFWQSVRLRLNFTDFPDGTTTCAFCGLACTSGCSSFMKEQDSFKYAGFWRHPHTPFQFVATDGTEQPRNLKVDDRGRFWTQMTGYFWESPAQPTHPGYRPALVVTQHARTWPGERLTLSVGGYVNKQAKIEGRTHETYSLGDGWEDRLADLERVLEPVLGIPAVLDSAIRTFAGKFGNGGMSRTQGKSLRQNGQDLYLALTEPELHARLRRIDDWRGIARLRDDLRRRLARHAWTVFTEVAQPFLHSPAGLAAHAAGRAVLIRGLRADAAGVDE